MFSNDVLVLHSGNWRGDLQVLGGSALWGLTTLYSKRYQMHRTSAFRILYGQLIVSTPLLLLASLALEPNPFFAVTGVTISMILFQAGVAVSFSYLMWTMWTVLLKRYAASAMQSFTFLTPVWGVLLGVLVLGEEVQALLILGIALVGSGIYLVNRPHRR
jgi:drug/metabolite transporter (DMT)-like permease